MGKTLSGDEAQTRQTNFGREKFNTEKSNFVLRTDSADQGLAEVRFGLYKTYPF